MVVLGHVVLIDDSEGVIFVCGLLMVVSRHVVFHNTNN